TGQITNYHFHREVAVAKQEVNVGGSVNVGGHFVVADSVRDSFNTLDASQAGPDVKEMVRRLGEAVVEMSRSLPPDKQQEAAQDFNTLAAEVAKATPVARYAKLAGEGLLAVAKSAANAAVPVLVTALLKHLGVGS
ncbi:MAG: hypothetical protein ACRC33_22255, partial [Gemmataceae bacterium]